MVRNNANSEFKYEITEHLGILKDMPDKGFSIEVNKISFNGRAPKLDIRKFLIDENHEVKLGKGISLTDDEGKTLLDILKKLYEK